MQIRQQNSYMTIDTYKNCEIQTKQECVISLAKVNAIDFLARNLLSKILNGLVNFMIWVFHWCNRFIVWNYIHIELISAVRDLVLV